MTLRQARKLADEKKKTAFEGITYIGNCVQNGRAANGEKADPNGWYVQVAIPGSVNEGKTGKYDMVMVGC